MTDGTLGVQSGSRWRIVGWSALGTVLLLPLIAMEFTGEVVWDLADFAVAALLLGATGLAVELAAHRSAQHAYRAAAALAAAGVLVLVWANLAVGLVGAEDNPLNLLFGLVVAVGLVGSAQVRFRAKGLMWVMVGMSVAQVLVGLMHLGTGHFTPVVTMLFSALWLFSAALFRTAAEAEDRVVRPVGGGRPGAG